MALLGISAAILFFCLAHRCTGFSLFSLPIPPPPPQLQQQQAAASIAQQKRNNPIEASFLLSSASTPAVQTYSQQMNDAMVIKSMRGTQWRVVEDRMTGVPSFGKNSPRVCKSVATFAGFAGVDNKGTVSVEYFCDGDNSRDNSDNAEPTTTTRGRWVTKPSRLARGSVQLSARWKVRLPGDNGGGTVIYKGFIDADKIIGRKGKSVNAEMVGEILTGEEVNKEKVIGKFTADLIRQLSEEEQSEAAKTAVANQDTGPITLSPVATSSSSETTSSSSSNSASSSPQTPSSESSATPVSTSPSSSSSSSTPPSQRFVPGNTLGEDALFGAAAPSASSSPSVVGSAALTSSSNPPSELPSPPSDPGTLPNASPSSVGAGASPRTNLE